MQVWSYIETDYDLLMDDHEAYADFPIRMAYKTQEDAVKACIAHIEELSEEFNEDLDEDDPIRMEAPASEDFVSQENGDLTYSNDGPVYRVYAINIE